MRSLRTLSFVCFAMAFAVPASAQTIKTVAGGGPNHVPAILAAIPPVGLAFDASGNYYVIALNHVFRVDSTGQLTVYAGNGMSGFAGDGGPATLAELAHPDGVAVDAAGNLFIADTSNNRIRRVDVATQVISTVAGNGTYGSSGDGGPATSAQLGLPSGVAVDSGGNLFIADSGTNLVRRVDSAKGIITTVAGGGGHGTGDGGPATSANLFGPLSVAVDNGGNLFINDAEHFRIRRVDAATGIITTVAGNGTWGYSGDGGPAASAQIGDIAFGIAVD